MTVNNETDKMDWLLNNAIWFVLAFVGLTVLFFFWRPLFVVDVIEPFWEFFALHNAMRNISAFLVFVYHEYGLFLLFVVILFFWWVFFTQRAGDKKR